MAIFSTDFEGVNASRMKVSSHCIALPGNVMPGEVGNGSGMLGHPLFAAHYNIHAGERSSHVSDIQLKSLLCGHTHFTHPRTCHLFCDIKEGLNA